MNTFCNWLVVILGIALTVVFGIQGLIAAYLLHLLINIVEVKTEIKITNALLVEQLLLLTEEDELEDCGGDCEQCICGKL